MGKAIRDMLTGLFSQDGVAGLGGLGSIGGARINPFMSALLTNALFHDVNPEEDGDECVTRIERCGCGMCFADLVVPNANAKEILQVQKLKGKIQRTEEVRDADARINVLMTKILAGEDVWSEPEAVEINSSDLFCALASLLNVVYTDHYISLLAEYYEMGDGPNKEALLARIDNLRSILEKSPEEFNQWLLSELGKPETDDQDALVAFAISTSRAIFSYTVSLWPKFGAKIEKRLEEKRAELQSLLKELGVKEDDPMFEQKPEVRVPLASVEALVAAMRDKNIGIDDVICLVQSSETRPKTHDSDQG